MTETALTILSIAAIAAAGGVVFITALIGHIEFCNRLHQAGFSASRGSPEHD